MQLNLKIKFLPLIGLLIALGACQPAPQPLPTEGQAPDSPGEVENESAEEDEENNQQENNDKDDDDDDDEEKKSEDDN